LRINTDLCKGCALCVKACKRALLQMADLNGGGGGGGREVARMTSPDACTGCRQCSDICPEAAIEMESVDSPANAEPAGRKAGTAAHTVPAS
jgi:2-oxoglutarate ferredoxin oxidoreductase subunit delta